MLNILFWIFLILWTWQRFWEFYLESDYLAWEILQMLPCNSKEDPPNGNIKKQDDVCLQKTCIYHVLMRSWLFVYLEEATSPCLLPVCSVIPLFILMAMLRFSNNVLCWGCSSFHGRCSSSTREQPAPGTSLQDPPMSCNHRSLSQLKQTSVWNALSQPPQYTPFFHFFFLTWIPAGSQCKSFQPWFTMEQEGFPLVSKVLVVLGKCTGCSQAGQDHTSRKVWLTRFPHWLSTQSAPVNIAPPRSPGWGAGARVQLIYGQAA